MTDLTRRQIMQMADEVGITDHAAAVRLVRLTLAAFRPTPVPVPVSERLPEAGEMCWVHMPDIGTAPSWRLVDPREIGPYHTHWLPTHALPVPSGERES